MRQSDSLSELALIRARVAQDLSRFSDYDYTLSRYLDLQQLEQYEFNDLYIDMVCLVELPEVENQRDMLR